MSSKKMALRSAKRSRRCRPTLEAFESRLLLTGSNFSVTALTDTGTGSGLSGDLRYCITNANSNPGSTIDIMTSGTVNLTSSLPALAADTSIINSTPGTFSLNGGGSSSNYNALTINNGVTATIDGLNFSNFHNSGNGGILDVEGSLTLDNADLGLSSCNNGGAVFVGFSGYLTTNQTNFHDNSSSNGGAILNFNSVVLNGGSLINNTASNVGGAILDDGYLYAIGAEFAGNIAESDGGAIYADAGMGVVTPNLLLTNCTIDSNAAVNRGGGIISYYNATLTNVTIANNTSSSGASGAGLYYGNAGATLTLFNSIIAQNSAGASESDIDGAGSISASSSYNLIGNTSLGGITDGSQGNQIGTAGSPLNAGLQSRAANGGTSYTLGLTPSSLALGAGGVANAIDPVTTDPLLYDQRGVGFPRVVNSVVDIGAFQTQLASTSLVVSPATGTYGGTTTITVTLSSGGNPVAGQYVDVHIGSTDLGLSASPTNASGQVTFSNVSLAAFNASNYTGAITASFAGDSSYGASNGSADLTVNPAPLTITADNQTKLYGDALPTLTASYSGFVNGDTPASLTTLPTLTTTATAGSHVAGSPYAITASGAVDTNYTISYIPGSLTVTPAPLTITADNQTKLYGDALPTLTASYSGFVNGDTPASLTTLPSLFSTATAGSHVAGSPYAITASGAVDSDYTISYVPGSLSVTPTPLTITADNQTKVYGAALPTLTASFSGFVNGDTAASLTTLPTLTTTATSGSHVAGSPYAITAGGAVDSDYTISYVPGSLTVTPAPLTITADNQTKVYGDALPTLTASYSGFVNGDTAASLTTLPTLTTTATAASHVAGNPYGISASGAVDPDYTIGYVPGSLTVTPAPLTIVGDQLSKVYGQANPAITGSIVGVLNGDDVQAQFGTSATAASDVVPGGYAINFENLTGAQAGDYTVVGAMPGRLTITPVPLTITAANATKLYGQPNPAFTASSSGFVLGQDDSVLSGALKFITPATAASHVGSYAIEPAGLTSNNYTISFAQGTLAVTPVPLTITANNASIPQGVAVPPLSATYSGFVNGDGPSSLTTPARLTTTATSASPAGLYPINVDSAASADYTIRFVPGALTVNASQPLTRIERQRVDFVSTLYHDLLGRAPEPSGLQYWTQRLANRSSRFSVALRIFRSPERANLQATHQGTGIGLFRAFVDAIRVARRANFNKASVAISSVAPGTHRFHR